MYEYHGWVTLREAPYFVEDGKINKIAQQISNYIEELNIDLGISNVHSINGEFFLLISGFNNHSDIHSTILQLYKFIARVSPGSYGLLYTRDDEDLNGKHNEFCVCVLSRGKLDIKSDPFLSPFISVVEDES